MEIVELVINNGIGAVIGMYALTILNSTVKENTKAINELKLYIAKHIKN